MRKLIIVSLAAAVSALTFAAPSNAAGFGISFGDSFFGSYSGSDHGGGRRYHRGYVVHYSDWPSDCYVRKVRKYDRHGNLVIRKIRYCN